MVTSTSTTSPTTTTRRCRRRRRQGQEQQEKQQRLFVTILLLLVTILVIQQPPQQQLQQQLQVLPWMVMPTTTTTTTARIIVIAAAAAMARTTPMIEAAAVAAASTTISSTTTTTRTQRVPTLQGQHLRITVLRSTGFLDFITTTNKDDEEEDINNNNNINNTNIRRNITFSGYIVDMIQALSIRANFTYELIPPSGLGPNCTPSLWKEQNTIHGQQFIYHSQYYNQYDCGTDDVNYDPIRALDHNNHDYDDDGTKDNEQQQEDDDHVNNTTTSTTTNTTTTIPPRRRHRYYATDLYAGMFYISPERQLQNHFTMPFSPPDKGTQVMYGIATELRTVQDLVDAQQQGLQPPACVLGSTAIIPFIQQAYPQIQIQSFFSGTNNNNSDDDDHDVYQSMMDGTCPIHIIDYPIATQFVLRRSQQGQCYGKNQQPIGIIGEPMSFGLAHYAIGVGKHLSSHVVQTLSFWINTLMTCNPDQEGNNNDKDNNNKDNVDNNTSLCPQGNLASFYQNKGGAGYECGYVLFPNQGHDNNNNDKANVSLICGLIAGGVAIVLIVFIVLHWIRLKHQEQRYKKRFVEQIARNIEIGPSPGLITPEKLAQEIQHIGQGKGYISKIDLQQWMHDIKLTFLSEDDFNALWDAMDIKRQDKIDPMEFILFLSACGPQFEQVYQQHASLPKTERLKLATRRLSNLAQVGEVGVRKIEQKLDRGSRELVPTTTTTTTTKTGPTAKTTTNATTTTNTTTIAVATASSSSPSSGVTGRHRPALLLPRGNPIVSSSCLSGRRRRRRRDVQEQQSTTVFFGRPRQSRDLSDRQLEA